jgi:pyrroloquinoline quinone biosynthesis protein B
MGHVPVSGDDGSMAGLAALPAKQRIFIHLNNTNPLLVDGCQEAVIAKANGWRVAFDGMEIVT